MNICSDIFQDKRRISESKSRVSWDKGVSESKPGCAGEDKRTIIFTPKVNPVSWRGDNFYMGVHNCKFCTFFLEWDATCLRALVTSALNCGI